VKQKYAALEHKYEGLDALIAELRSSDKDVALSLLVRLRTGELALDMLQSRSPESMSPNFIANVTRLEPARLYILPPVNTRLSIFRQLAFHQTLRDQVKEVDDINQ
jgi:hypothetical protein